MSMVNSPLDDESIDYYFGNISRETAEYILWDKGCIDSMFLLRKSNSDYVLSLCYQKSILHYRITRLPNGEAVLHGLEAQKFPNINTLIEKVDGLAIKPSIMCSKWSGWQLPPTYWGLSLTEIRKAVINKSKKWGLSDSLIALPMEYLSITNQEYSRNIITKIAKSLINKTLHEIQPWFHGRLSRLDAERSIEQSGHKEGKFLARERDETSFALCLSHEGKIKHYRIDVLSSGEFIIQDGHKFPSILSLVSYYTIFLDGLWTCLGESCPRLILINNPVTSVEESTHQNRFNNNIRTRKRLNSRSVSLDRNHHKSLNFRPFKYNSISISNSTIKPKQWLNTINQKWSQLLSVIASKHDSNRFDKHFSSLPRRHILTNASNNIQIYPSVYDYAQEDLNNSLSFRSLNVEMMRPWAHPFYNSLMPRELNIQSPQAFCESNHYQKNQLFSKPNCVNDSEKKTRRVNFASDFKSSSSQTPLVKSSSLKDLYSLCLHHCTLNHEPQVAQCNRTLPTPIIKQSKPKIQEPFSVIHYANQEAILHHQNNNQSKSNKCDLLILADEISENPVVKTTNSSKVDTVTLSVKNSVEELDHFNLTDNKNSLIDLLINECFSSSSIDELSEAGIATTVNMDQETARLAVNSKDNCSESKTLSTTEKIYEEIDEQLDQILKKNLKVNILKEFDNCYNSDESSLRDKAETSKSQSVNITNLSSFDKKEKHSSYDYDALKFDKSFLTKKASLGIASLETNTSGSIVNINQMDLICLQEDPTEINQTIEKYQKGPLSLDSNFITLQRRLGTGYFGEVYLGTIPSFNSNASIQVAVKLLKSESVPNHKNEILKEAKAMSSLDHKHIVRLIGVCESDPIMIAMELAPLGPLNQYLLDYGFCVSINDIIALLLQVAMAMQYLESKQFIHRDLAARNVLLVNEKFAKISDFGMSRALGIGKEYYRAKSASKWPLKWYAPECIYYFKFSSKSDVWSFGVTLWESLSYGKKPYEGMDGQDILRLFRENRRLAKPDNCPDEMFKLMLNCWQFRPEDRPNFTEICQNMMTYFLCLTS